MHSLRSNQSPDAASEGHRHGGADPGEGHRHEGTDPGQEHPAHDQSEGAHHQDEGQIPQMQRRIRRLQGLNRLKNQRIHYWKKKALSLRTKLVAKRDELEKVKANMSFLVLYKKRHTSSAHFKMSRRGGYRLAIKRNQGHVGSEALVQQQECATGRQTVSRWQRILTAAILLVSHRYYSEHYAHLTSLDEPDKPNFLTYEMHSLRADATNHMMLKSKAHVCEITSIFSHSPYGETGLHRTYSDLQRVPKKCDGVATRAMLLKQFAAVGARTWIESEQDENIIAGRIIHVSWYLFASDAGPDQFACDGLVDADLMHDHYKLKVRTFCIQHQIHLIVKRGILKLGATYWSTLAKCVNCIRTWLQPMLDTWMNMFGASSAKTILGKLPPWPVKGRWGSLSNCERWMLSAGRERLVSVYDHAIVEPRRAKVAKPSRRNPATAEMEEDEIAYDEKMNRWVRESAEGIHTDEFWLKMTIGFACRQPLDHMRHWLQRQTRQSRDLRDASTSTMTQLVCGKADEIFQEFNELCEAGANGILHQAWSQMVEWANGADWYSTSAALLLDTAVDYYRRVVLPCRLWPRLLLWLVHRPCLLGCAQRFTSIRVIGCLGAWARL